MIDKMFGYYIFCQRKEYSKDRFNKTHSQERQRKLDDEITQR